MAVCLALPPLLKGGAGAAARPPIKTTNRGGTDGVLNFRNVNHQSIVIVTMRRRHRPPTRSPRPAAGGAEYIARFFFFARKSPKPIKYLNLSHPHYDHIAGGKAFKGAGGDRRAPGAPRNASPVAMDPAKPLPDEVGGTTAGRVISMGGKSSADLRRHLNTPTRRWCSRMPQEQLIFWWIAGGAFPVSA